jgi:hypothetical protein
MLRDEIERLLNNLTAKDAKLPATSEGNTKVLVMYLICENILKMFPFSLEIVIL